MELTELIQSKLHRLEKVIWYLLVLSLPFTSMPAIKTLLGSDSVASPAIVFLIVLILIMPIKLVKSRQLLISKKIIPLLLFLSIAVLATLIALFYKVPAFKGFDYFRPGLTALATLVLGVMFFTAASSFPVKADVKKKTLILINWSGLLILIWCLIQAGYWYGSHHYPPWMYKIQGVLSARILFRQRVTGFALEPSWLAHQLNMLYLPLWLSATINGYSNHSIKIRKFSFENLLLIGGVFVLALTLSRVGFMAFMMMLLLVIILLHNRFVVVVNNWIGKRKGNQFRLSQTVISFAILFAYFILFLIFLVIYSRFDPRMGGFFNINLGLDNPLLRYFNQMKFGDRVIYWLTGWNIFNRFPVVGTGLGNAGFYFPENIPAYGWSLIEVRKLLYRSDILLNIKSLWFRLLAETGVIGFSLFIGWLVSLYATLAEKIKSRLPMERTLGFAGVFVLAGLIFEGMSIDSFAMPYWWVSLGLAVSAIDEVALHESQQVEKVYETAG